LFKTDRETLEPVGQGAKLISAPKIVTQAVRYTAQALRYAAEVLCP
jgi:hypothetical protein